MRPILNCMKYTVYKDMLTHLDWLPIGQYFSFQLLILVCKIKTALTPKYLTRNLIYNSEIGQEEIFMYKLEIRKIVKFHIL